MDDFLTGRDAAETVKIEGGRLPYPIKKTVKWFGTKGVPTDMMSTKEVVKAYLETTGWSTSVKNDAGTWDKVKLPKIQFSIIAVGFRVSYFNDQGNEFWESSLSLDSRTQPIQIWVEKTCLFNGLYKSPEFEQQIRAKYPKCKFTNSLIVVWDGEITEIKAGKLLCDSICLDAKEFLGKGINIFGLTSNPPLTFRTPADSKTIRKVNKDSEEWKAGKDCFFMPILQCGILFNPITTIAKKEEFMAWANQSVKTPEPPKVEAESVTAQIYSPPVYAQPVDTPFDIASLDDSEDLPF